eukprot:gene24518-29820_t
MTSDPGLCAVKSVFPGGCPHLTIVGATMGPEKGSKTEVVCQADKGGTITSGGGFSVVFDRPKWQEDVVTYYLTKPENLPTKLTPRWCVVSDSRYGLAVRETHAMVFAADARRFDIEVGKLGLRGITVISVS